MRTDVTDTAMVILGSSPEGPDAEKVCIKMIGFFFIELRDYANGWLVISA